MNVNKLLYLDTETTGVDKESRIVQLCYLVSGSRRMVDKVFKPPVKIDAMASATHHITEEDVEDEEEFIGSETEQELKALLKDHILVAHNAPFDIRMLEKEGVDVRNYIDTLRIARAVLPDLRSHKLQYLRYKLKLNLEDDHGIEAHSAKGDVLILERLFRFLYGRMAEAYKDPIILEMMKAKYEPRMMKIMHFGKKHRGKHFKEILQDDRQYLEWFLAQEQKKKKPNKDLLFTLEHYLKK